MTFKMVMFTDRELIIIAIALDDEYENEVKNKKRKWVQEAWKNRDSEGEFAKLFKELMDDGTKFFYYFGMSEGTFNLLLSKLEVHLKKQDTHWRKAISPKERLAVCLRYLATGDSFQTVSCKYRMGLSTVYNIVMETCKVICENLLSIVLPKPTVNKWKSIANDFYKVWNFPNCLGALGGKQITIQNTGASPNNKKTYSVVVLALVDAHYNFIAIDIGSYGEKTNGGIFSNSTLFKEFDEGTLSIPQYAPLPNTNTEQPYVLVADDKFPLRPYLMRPFPHRKDLDIPKRIYNNHLYRVRNIAENTFGVLSQKFQIYNRIQAAPHNISNIVLATCILHNFIKKHDGNYCYCDRYEGSEVVGECLEDLPPLQGGNSSKEALRVREGFKHYFNSSVESVPSQEYSD